MSKPIGDAPTADDIEGYVQSFFSKHSYGPFSTERVSSNHLIFTSQTYPVQFELMFDDEMETIEYKVYETPQPDGETLKEGTKHSDIPFNPALSWEKFFGRFLMSISGIINGAIHRGDLDPRE